MVRVLQKYIKFILSTNLPQYPFGIVGQSQGYDRKGPSGNVADIYCNCKWFSNVTPCFGKTTSYGFFVFLKNKLGKKNVTKIYLLD